MSARAAARAVRRSARDARRRVRTEIDWVATRRARADLALFHEFAASPSGGGHQFLRALVGELEGRGFGVELNRLSSGTRACLFNSFNFDAVRLRRFARPDCRMVHRVDGPVGVYRGFDDGTDGTITAINDELADATVLQSQYSLREHEKRGLLLRAPVVISNSVDPAIFHPPAERASVADRVRVITTSWSDNERKGAETLAWLDGHLDRDRYELTFVGRTSRSFEWTRVIGPVASPELATHLRGHDVYLALSRDDPCSNALLEALACGLPVVYRDSGGHPELVGDGGLSFALDEEIPHVLDRLVEELDARREAIVVPSIASVADRYLTVLGLVGDGRP